VSGADAVNRPHARHVIAGMTRYLIAAGAALTLVLASCSSSSHTTKNTAASSATAASAASASTTAATAPAATGGIVINGFAFSGTLTVKAGQKVTVTNKDSVAHTLTDKQTHKFDTGNIAGNGGTGTFTAPTTPGSYPFGCRYHPDMHGTLVVQ
jgi:plastocyanin